MPKRELELDLNPLIKYASKNIDKLLLKEALNSNKFAQVGINIFRDQANSIWQIQKGEDGQDYIVRGGVDESKISEASNEWEAITDSAKANITLSFRKMPICKFAATEFGLTSEDLIEDFRQYLLENVKEASFVHSLYAYATGKCPTCGTKPQHIELNKVVCSTPSCQK